MYKLIDLQKHEVPGLYYESQLTKAPPPSDKDYFLIEKVLKEKTVKRKKFLFVKFLFYPEKVNMTIFERGKKILSRRLNKKIYP